MMRSKKTFTKSSSSRRTPLMVAVAVVAVVGGIAIGVRARPVASSAADVPAAAQSVASPAVILPAGTPAALPDAATRYCSDDAAGRAAMDKVRQALVLQQSFNTAKSGRLSNALDGARADALIQTSNLAVDTLYEPAAARERRGMYAESIKSLVGNAAFLALGGGVSTFTCGSIKHADATIEVRASATTWATLAEVRSDGVLAFAQPANLMAVTAAVSVDSHGAVAKIRTLDLEFANGTAP